MTTITKFALPGIGFLLTLISGFGVSSAGKPYNGILFNIHKLIALAAVILTGVQVAKWFKLTEASAIIISFSCSLWQRSVS